MGAVITDLIHELAEHDFAARVFQNGRQTGVDVTYSKPWRITVEHLKPPFPQTVAFAGPGEPIMVSDKGPERLSYLDKYTSVVDRGLTGIYTMALLDPRLIGNIDVLVPVDDNGALEIIEDIGSEEVLIYVCYALDKVLERVKPPDLERQWILNVEGPRGSATFLAKKNHLTEMRIPEIGDQQQEVCLRFSGLPWAP